MYKRQALEQVVALPEDDRDAIAFQILSSLAKEDSWKKRLAEKSDVVRRMAREALEEDERGETRPLDELLNAVAGHPGVLALFFDPPVDTTRCV